MRSCEARLELMAELARLKSGESWSTYELAYLRFTIARLKAGDYADATGYLDELERKLRDKVQRVRELKASIDLMEPK